MRERDIEAMLVQGVKKLGGRAYKWVSPGNAGVPDRIVVLPYGQIVFVELKTEKGRLSAQQKVQIKRLEEMGADVLTLYGSEDVQRALREWERELRLKKKSQEIMEHVFCKRDYGEGGMSNENCN